MRAKRLTLLSLILSVFLFHLPVAYADHHKHCGMYPQEVLMSLDLTMQQKMKLKNIKEAAKKDMEPVKKQLRDIHKELRAVAEADTLDEAKLANLINMKKEAVGTMTKMKVLVMHEIRQILDAKQTAELKAKMDKWRSEYKHKECACKKK